MGDLYKTIIVALLSLFVSVISFRYQFKRTRLVGHRSKIRLLVNLMKEAVGIAQLQITSLNTLLEKLKADKLFMPQLNQSAYPAAKELAERVIDDGYFEAFSTVFRNVVESESRFFELKYSSVLLNAQTEKIFANIARNFTADAERRKLFVDEYHKTINLIDTLSSSATPETKPFFNQIFAVAINYNAKCKPLDGRGNIDDIEKLIVEPTLLILSVDNLPTVLTPILLSMSNMDYQFHDILYQNEAMIGQLEEAVKPLETVVIDLKKIYKRLTDQQLKNLYERVY